MGRYGIHLAANDADDQTLFLEAELLEDGDGYTPDPEQDPIRVTWTAKGNGADGLLYLDEDDTTNEIVWSGVDAIVSKTTLLAMAPNRTRWRLLKVRSRAEVEEAGVGYPKGIYVVQAITPV
jgi:hypothetical protein